MPKGLASDPMNDTHWVYTDQALYEIVIKDEDRDVWRAKLDLGEFEDALRYSKVIGRKEKPCGDRPLISISAES